MVNQGYKLFLAHEVKAIADVVVIKMAHKAETNDFTVLHKYCTSCVKQQKIKMVYKDSKFVHQWFR